MKVLITGSSGTGKSTAIGELARRGYTAIDGDEEPGLARLELQATGEPVEWPDGFVDWKKYSWNLQETALKEVLARDEHVFLGGIYGNQWQYYDLFDKLVVLDVARAVHRRNLEARPPREFGEDPLNFQHKLEKNPGMLQRFIQAGAVAVNASGSVEQTADGILEVVNVRQ